MGLAASGLVVMGLTAGLPRVEFFTPALAQSDATDSGLAQASGRTVALRALSGGPVANVPLEVYVARVLAGEGEPGAPEATQQALAIAIRTYAVFNARRHARDGFDLCDTTHCQVLRTATDASRRATLATAGRILTYRGAPAEIFYSASCGGRSEDASAVWPAASLPYLRSQRDDVHDDDEEWTLDLPLSTVETALARAGFTGTLREVEVEDRTRSGRVATLHLRGLRPGEIDGDAFRLAVGAARVRSTAFRLDQRGETLRLRGRGYGHGVGMCVVGAGRRARRGETVEQILDQYFPGLSISSLNDVPASIDTRARPPAPPAAVPAAPPSSPSAAARGAGVLARVPSSSAISGTDLERMTAQAMNGIAAALRVPALTVTVELHDTIDGFRAATGQPWWVDASTVGGTIHLAPAAVLAQRDGVERAVRTAVARTLVDPALAGRPAWVRVGAARYFADGPRSAAPPERNAPRLRCPADGELTLAVSAAAQREAEARAEACFARGYAQSGDWRTVK